ncbi:hypothetical protein RchiOBHm_Chr6g0255051 [Rosa chinensis]|uniref:Uncharacterized protein n=1 Tax=Rosa chinensis TaxID=74649 RepID=A0A2P6PLS0_ROSCH|nr:hypothetical protein RchiOBHm_Chr6g0255051 [Rosa chinensis]
MKTERSRVYLGSLPDNNKWYLPLSHHLCILERVVKNGSGANPLSKVTKGVSMDLL